jgi:hypothetical protein
VAQYRKATLPIELEVLGETLQSALVDALGRQVGGLALSANVSERTLSLETDKQLLLNSVSLEADYTFGQVVMAMPGGLVPLVGRSAAPVAELPIRQDRPAAGHDYMPGLLYFLAVGNHVIVAESSSIRSALLARYLTWLLGPAKGELFEGGNVELNAKVEMHMGEDRPLPPVEMAVFRPEFEARQERRQRAKSAGTVEERTRILGESSFLDQKGRGILEAAGATDASLRRIMDNLPDEATLEVVVQVKAKVRDKVAPVDPNLINDLFNVSEADQVVLKGPHGQQIGEIARLKQDVDVRTVGNLLDRTDMERALWDAYTQLSRDGLIGGEE